jgi:hypothetical protein
MSHPLDQFALPHVVMAEFRNYKRRWPAMAHAKFRENLSAGSKVEMGYEDCLAISYIFNLILTRKNN